MGAIKWTGEAFKFVGEIMTAEGVEEWLREMGKTSAAKVASWATQNYRTTATEAHRQLIDATDTLHVALHNTLATLPSFINAASDEILKGNVSVLYKQECFGSYASAFKGYENYLYAIPRDLVLLRFEAHVLGEFSQSAHLGNFPGLIDKALSSLSIDAERAFFEGQTAQKPTWFDKKRAVVDIESKTLWQNERVRGHYYFGHFRFGERDFQSKVSELKPILDDGIGRLTRIARSEILSKLYPKQIVA